jgi:hypothetical protein
MKEVHFYTPNVPFKLLINQSQVECKIKLTKLSLTRHLAWHGKIVAPEAI